MSASYAGKALHTVTIFSDINILFIERKHSSVIFAHTKPQERISLCHIRKHTLRYFLIKSLTESVKHPKLKHNHHLRKSMSPKKLNNRPTLNRRSHIKNQLRLPNRLDNIIDPDDNEQFLKDIEKHESQDQALIKFSQQYGEPWHEDKQLKRLYKTT